MSVGPVFGPAQRPSDDRDFAEILRRLADLERNKPIVDAIQFLIDNEGGWLYVQTNDCLDLDTMPDPVAEGGDWGQVLVDDSGCGFLIGSNEGPLRLKARGDILTLLADGTPSAAALNLNVNSADATVNLQQSGDSFVVADHLGSPIVTWTG